ncbi:hypothetical protein C0Q70_00522 [Pomacea canaliculata]|uniref:Ribosome biogenesis regulatory protein n=1 Tax=Pomacea canaliculata TaxID=400727 RepID=A0A2T7PWZ7_POMCA|nr:ribosome biogenesis regulatory protein homolog [Pomacea canaliculata]PVD37920.1 hypothetical protein C0Q70_00522 [Pomacea canaliculata]
MANMEVAKFEEILGSKAKNFKSIDVQKALDVEVDAGNLAIYDPNMLDLASKNTEESLKAVTRDNVQLLLNRLWELPVERRENVIIVKLPEPTTKLPREKAVPKEKPLTKWQQYAKLKGIKNTKKGRMLWDPEAKEWRPRWGYNRINSEKEKWAIEVKEGADAFEDPFAKLKKEKQERVAKNELQRLRNFARARKMKVSTDGPASSAPAKDEILKSLAVTRRSDASMGKFSETLPKEAKNKFSGRKRKFEQNNVSAAQEKQRHLDIISKLESGQAVLDVQKATNAVMNAEDQARANETHDSKDMKKRKTAGKSGKKGQFGKAVKMGKGKTGKGKMGKGRVGKGKMGKGQMGKGQMRKRK